MERSGLSRVIPIIIVIIVIALAIWAMVSLGRAMFGGDSSTTSTTEPVNNGKAALTQTTADRSVRMTVRGPIVASENFNSYTITVTPSSRTMTTYVGYVGQQINTEQLSNDTQAYTQFVSALSRAHLMEGTPFTGDADNTSGICATGNVYQFEVLQGDNTVQDLWTSTCKGSPGSLKASLAQVVSLFRAQIPSYAKLTAQLNV